MDIYNIRNMTFEYPNGKKALKDINLDIAKGELIVICGESGCGKTTLLKSLKSVLSPFGKRDGEIYYKSQLLDTVDERTQASEIGYVFQNPDNQIVTEKVWSELAFGQESLGLDSETIRLRVAEMASFFGIQNWFDKSVSALSGGQRQLLNLASIMVMQPQVILLDEPTSQLDPIAAREFLETVGRINKELGTTVIISEHRLEEILPMADRMIVMDRGSVVAEGNPREVGRYLSSIKHNMMYAMPAAMRMCGYTNGEGEIPITVREGRKWLSSVIVTPITLDIKDIDTKGESIISIKELWFKYEKDTPDIIKGLNIDIKKGEIYAVVGGNGTGKTTALSVICGINKAYRGSINIEKDIKVCMLPQNPQSVFVCNTVKKDLLESGCDEGTLIDMARLCRIEDLLDSHPYDLSGGEQQRAALAKVLLLKPDVLLLDEPTKGLDEYFKIELKEILMDLKKNGVTMVMVSHDVEFCASYADRCGMFFDGSIVSEGSAKRFFNNNSFYTTAVNRICRDKIINAVTMQDAETVLKGTENEVKALEKPFTSLTDIKPIELKNTEEEKKSVNKRMILASILILLVIPMTIYFGMTVLNDRKYYFISMLIVVYTMIPFAMRFESRKPQARELVLISAMCALGVLGRVIFFMIPQFKPVIALVIIAGVCLGSEAGFMVGSITGFASNFFFGQGPWTPWQMFSFGIIGFLGGLLFKKGRIPKGRIPLTIYGVIATVVIYGGIMNPASVLMYQAQPTVTMILASYVTGIWFDLIHSASTAVFMLLLSQVMIEKIERIKLKYGILEG